MEVFLLRYRKLQEKMRENRISAALLSYHRDVFYYAGTGQPCNLLIPQEGEPTLFVRRAFDFVRRETFLEDLVPATGLGSVYRKLREKFPGGGVLGIAEDIIPVRLYRRMEDIFYGFSLTDISPLVLQQRAVKEQEEIELIKEAAKLFGEAHRAVLENLRAGITERELSTRVYSYIRRAGGEAVNFHRRWDDFSAHEGFLAGSKTSWQISGKAMTVTGKGTGASLPWGASDEKLDRGDLVVLDIGLNRGGYHGDIARTYVVGKATSLQKERYRVLQAIMEKALQKVRPGVPAQKVYLAALNQAERLGVKEYFQGWGEMQGNYIGHGIGLEMDEPPTLMKGLTDPLQENMVLCVEPKLIVPRWGAVDLEEMVVVKKGAPEIISPVSSQLWEVEG